MPNLRFAIDDNLGVPEGFSEGLERVVRSGQLFDGYELVSFHDIGAMIKAFDQKEVALTFAPAGTLPYLQTTPKILAESTVGPRHATTLRSVLVMRASDPLASAEEMVRRKMGRVNAYCTTSYWAPMVALQKNDAAPKSLDFYEAAGFDDMLFSVLDGRSDVAMVWDEVLAKYPDMIPKTRTLAEYDDLPTPLLLANDLLTGPALEAITAFATHFQSPHPQGYFNGFTQPALDRINRFRDGMEQARKSFGV